ncbi:MAG: hypothetical protein LBV40_05215 [Methanomicrobiales archaeon]|jgi:hypothetical protein|nr:hypothetical protein [Methanomicrobiales archaeon]
MSQGAQDLEADYKASLSEVKMRLQELEALVKGLTDEVLDLRAVILHIQKEKRTAPVIREVPIQNENRPSPIRPIITATPAVENIPNKNAQVPSSSHDSDSSLIGAKNTGKKEEHMVPKMQRDGTVRLTKESGEDIIIASALDSRNKEGTKKKSVNDIIVADE